ncbi:hypothetical protein [Fibrobacter sp. UWEL]|uniref:hypothetical protein n=1 Tax=Fibrobacter sp. UWEL TaxID=1896209 RepID=UPI000913AAB5|nr:hypothetical protein [Fibrobacter sp. UWEL]SHL06249.1 Lamin Tail Domain [Fibrobacter sp. UWEL]
MSPMIKTRGLFGTAATLLCAGALWNCSSDTTGENSSAALNAASSNVALKLEYNAPPLLDSLVLDCEGADTLHLVHSSNDGNFSLDLFPSDHWNFKAKIYANGALMQVGELETKLEAGTNVNLNIQMHPLVGFVYVEIPLGLGNSAGIQSGLMTLTSDENRYEIPMVLGTSKGYFKSEMLKLGVHYDVTIALMDADGNEIYSLSDKFLLSEDSPNPDLSLQALRAQISLAIQAAAEKNVNLTLPLPAGYRLPRAEELLITEYFSAPDSKDSSQYEFVEIFNGSLDTLILDDCTLNVTSGSTSKSFVLTVSEIPPAEVLVLGSANSERTPAGYVNTEGWLDLGNSKGAISLKCGNEVMDELYYATEPDSIHTSAVPALGSGKYGSSGQLDIDKWKTRYDATAWCLGAPTPGELSFCN